MFVHPHHIGVFSLTRGGAAPSAPAEESTATSSKGAAAPSAPARSSHSKIPKGYRSSDTPSPPTSVGRRPNSVVRSYPKRGNLRSQFLKILQSPWPSNLLRHRQITLQVRRLLSLGNNSNLIHHLLGLVHHQDHLLFTL